MKEAAAAAVTAVEQAQLCAAVLDALEILEGKSGGEPDWERSQLPDGPCCAITCLPLKLCPAVPAVEFGGGRSWVSALCCSLTLHLRQGRLAIHWESVLSVCRSPR